MKLPESLYIQDRDTIIFTAHIVAVTREYDGAVAIYFKQDTEASDIIKIISAGSTADRLWRLMTFHSFWIKSDETENTHDN